MMADDAAVLTEDILKLATTLANAPEVSANQVGKLQLIVSMLLLERADLIHEIKLWKSKAAKHGCDVENGDPDCG